MTLPRLSAPLALSLALAVALSGCGGWRESRINPKNWFGKAEEAQTLAPKEGYPEVANDPRELVAQITSLEVKATQGGAIVMAEGITPTQGWWGADLLAENDGKPVDGVVTYRFVIAWPDPGSAASQRVLTPQSRTVSASAFINSTRLASVRKVVVVGASNQRSLSR